VNHVGTEQCQHVCGRGPAHQFVTSRTSGRLFSLSFSFSSGAARPAVPPAARSCRYARPGEEPDDRVAAIRLRFGTEVEVDKLAQRVPDENASCAELLVIQNRLAIAYGCDRNAQRRGAFHDLGRGVLAGPCMDDLVPLAKSHDSANEQRQLRIFEQVGTVDENQEIPKLLAGVRAKTDVSVRGRLDRRCFQHARRRGQRGTSKQASEEIEEVRRGERHTLEHG